MANRLTSIEAVQGHLDEIDVSLPFSFSDELDPRKIASVGDQVLADHIFSYHSRESLRDGFQPVVSDVQFDWSSGEITIAPRVPMSLADGRRVTDTEICASIRASFSNTRHAPFASLLRGIHCDGTTTRVQLRSIPVNMPFLFTLPDFSIFDPEVLPFTATHMAPTSGPYTLAALSRREARLRRNPHYPASLRANGVDRVLLHWYNTQDTVDYLANAASERQHLIYSYGYAVTDEALQRIQARGYSVEEFPSEWVMYVGFRDTVSQQDRVCISRVLDEIRPTLSEINQRALMAYSIAPVDRPFGISPHTYRQTVEPLCATPTPLARPYTIGTYHTLAHVPCFKAVLDGIQQRYPTLALKHARTREEFTHDLDVYIGPLGISPADPLSHLAYLSDTDPLVRAVVTPEAITQAAIQSSADEFIRQVTALETRILETRALVPLAHFPGIVLQAPQFERDEALAWSWGIQAWTYRIK